MNEIQDKTISSAINTRNIATWTERQLEISEGKEAEAVTAPSDKMTSSQLDVAVWIGRKNPAVKSWKTKQHFYQNEKKKMWEWLFLWFDKPAVVMTTLIRYGMET